ncbi:MAG: murein transglycosylase A [Halocynthiibacter sp.]
MRHALRAALVMAIVAVTVPAKATQMTYSLLRFDQLIGWKEDNLQVALSVFLETCADMDGADWTALCGLARTQPSARTFFELFFRPVMVEDGAPALFTGYFEPELTGSLTPTDRFRYPLYRRPPEANGQWLTRRQIEESGVLRGRGLEIAWVDDPVEVFFLQIQGSGRVRLANGGVIRVGYGGANGQPYRSIGQELVQRGVYRPHQVSAQVIRNWVQRNPVDGRDLLRTNPAYVFFRPLSNVPADKGPRGAMDRSVTPMRSVAVDPAFVPLGAPVWLEKGGADAMNRLMIAQDTGSAIKGAQRADIFYGTGDEAGRAAGRVRDGGRMVMLLPIQIAFELVPEGG